MKSKTEDNVDRIISLMNKYNRYTGTSLYEITWNRHIRNSDNTELQEDRQTIRPHLKLFLFALSLPCLEKLGR